MQRYWNMTPRALILSKRSSAAPGGYVSLTEEEAQSAFVQELVETGDLVEGDTKPGASKPPSVKTTYIPQVVIQKEEPPEEPPEEQDPDLSPDQLEKQLYDMTKQALTSLCSRQEIEISSRDTKAELVDRIIEWSEDRYDLLLEELTEK